MRKRQQIQIMQLATVVLIMLAIMYFLCKLGGPSPWLDLGLAPDNCWLSFPSNDTNGGGGAGDTCPPIDVKLREFHTPILNTASTTCLAGTGTWTETSTLISCASPFNTINCLELSRNELMLRLLYDAHRYGARYRCQPNWVGIWCPGSGPSPFPLQTSCGWYYTSGDTQVSCGGPCPDGQECTSYGDTCSCQDMQTEYTCETLGGGASICSLGTCPPGQYCESMITGQCGCIAQTHL